ncbi:uncharacterized protein LOC115212339 [Octopus sinensis]|uniref:Uncharacterized protein LOC115212339 n=1 Tax=Octopus sinensis TaxID=2607531 RepID=A0A6P7SF40_9MOLL|nr:uncharacterized protein LOC115212339 [Octopus sinensis]
MELNNIYKNKDIFRFSQLRSSILRDSDSDEEGRKESATLQKGKKNTRLFGSNGSLQKPKQQYDNISKSTECLAAPKKEKTKKKKKKAETTTMKEANLARELFNIDFPLKDTHIFSLACETCFRKISEGPKGCQLKQPCIDCNKSKLVIKKIGDQFWTEIRRRPTRIKNNYLNYNVCYDFKKNKACLNTPCTFPHGEAELCIWTMEQNEEFDTDEFITVLGRHNIGTTKLFEEKKKIKFLPGLTTSTNTTSIINKHEFPAKGEYSSEATKTTEEIMNSFQRKSPITYRTDPALEPVYEADFQRYPHPLYHSHDYKYFCSNCFLKPNSDSSHKCDKDILAFAKKGTSNWLVVRNRLKYIQSSYQLCTSVGNKDMPCIMGPADCYFAHNNVEKLLWNLEKDKKFSISSLISKDKTVSFGFVFSRHGNQFDFICKYCFKSGAIAGQSSENTLYCKSNYQHLWENSKILQHTLEFTFTLIRKPYSSENKDYKLCQTLKCKKDNCIYAHSMVERDVWMVLRDQCISMEDFVSYCKAAKTKPPYMLNEFCRICYSFGKMLTHSQCQHDKIHGSIYTTKTNERRIINHLPSVIPSKYNFVICNHVKNNKCTKTSTIECTFAHNSEEIVIWKWMCNNNVKTLEEYVRLQNQCHPRVNSNSSLNSNETKVTKNENINTPSVSQNRFKELGGYSSIINKPPVSRENPKLSNDINGTHGNGCLASPLKAEKIPESSTNQIKPILVECCNTVTEPLYQMLPNIKITMNMTSSESKKSIHQWYFEVFSMKHNLQKIKILTDKIREKFFLIPTAKTNDSNPTFSNMFKIEEYKWKVHIIYTGDACETFSVSVIFDFGIKRLLSYPIDLKISPAENTKGVKTCLKASTNTQLNATKPVDLMTKYKIPENLVLNEHNTELALKKDNYVETMHTLLYAEETACQNIISRYNFRSEMKISCYINDASGTFFSDVNGSLFGIVDFSASLLHEDPDNLVSKYCESVLLSLTSNTNKFYEIPITKKTNPPFVGLQQGTLYLTFNKQHVRDLKLENGHSFGVEIHFKLSRGRFLKMHHAVDSLISTEIVFPSTSTIPLENENHNYSDTHLNEDQLYAVKHIPCKCTDARPPFVMIGSFGTGKTETLLSIITKVVENNSTAKILICTHTNGAADMFIIKHLHKFLSRNKKTLYLKRLYFEGRRRETIDPVVQKYVIFPSKNQLKSDIVDPQSMQILVTTMEMCHHLMTMEIQGCFSHIFVDEAAQVFESMVLIPLSLASEKTCVVLCGDPNQLGPEVHSTNAAKDLLSISIVKRLYEYYKKQGQKNKVMQHLPYVMLKQNYRSCKEIVNFLAYSFYGLSHEMTSKVQNPVSDMKALQFYSVEGTAETLPQNMSYYNKMEAEEVRTIVTNVMKSWPDEEEKLSPEDICVVSNELNQVKLIREYLSGKHITVDSVISVQGKQFKVVIISTVYTTSSGLCNGAEYTNFLNNKLLLNTAMSRAKYVVIVVGDPVALCISGDCKYIWQNFIQSCSELNTLYPAHYTYDVIHSKIFALLNSISQEEYAAETYEDEMEANPNINNCIKHHKCPQECFPLLYTESIDNLKRPIIDAICQEAFCTAITTSLVMFVDINIKWDQNQGCGEFCIKSSILNAKNIELHSAQSMTNIPDWFCIKYKGHQASATYFIHVWILEVKSEYDNLVVKIRVIDSEVDTLKQITDNLSCSMWLISFDNFYRFLISSVIDMDTISSLIKIYVNDFHKIPKKLVEDSFPEQIVKYEYPTDGFRMIKLVEWLYLASNNDRAKTENYQIIVCSKNESTLDAIANQLKTQQILENCIMRVADEKTEDSYFEKYWQSNVSINSQDGLTYLHEHLLWKNSLFQKYMETVKTLKATGIDVSLQTNKFKENILENSNIIFCNIVTTNRQLFKKLNKKKMIVIADAANHTEMSVVLPLLLDNIQSVFLFTTP